MHSQSHLHLILLLILTVTSVITTAQSPPTQNREPTLHKATMSSTMSILLIILLTVFVVLVFFSVYIRQYIAMNSTSSPPSPTLARSIKRNGLNPETLSSFPTLIYSQVKDHNLSKSVLECAVCLNEFEGSETLRLLPNCSHAFHTECIDAWLAAHVTCPVCRCNLTEPVQNKEGDNEVVIEVEDDEERRLEMDELEQFVSVKRGRHFRSYTTGMVGGEDMERYTLRLPEKVKNEIMLKRTSSCVVFSGEESEKKGFRRTEKLGSLLKRAMSMKNGRFLRWDSGKSEGSVRSKGCSFRHVISQFDCCPGSSSGGGVDCDRLDKVEKLAGADSSREKVSSV